MAENSKIEWCHATFNPWSGCTKVSDGCKFCYAEVNYSVKVRGVKWGPQGNRVVASESMWKQPLKWDKAAAKAGERHRVFCASLADVFEDWTGPVTGSGSDAGRQLWMCQDCQSGYAATPGPCTYCQKQLGALTMQAVRLRLFDLIDSTPNLDWLLLTKRPENIAKMMPEYKQTVPSQNVFFGQEAERRGLEHGKVYESTLTRSGPDIVRPNVWIGTSVENQKTADERIPHLLRTPAAVRFLSVEPLLGPVELRWQCNALHPGDPSMCDSSGAGCLCRGLHWIICGGESGHSARPCNVAWIRSIVEQCKAAGVACFVKQLGSNSHMTWREFCKWKANPPAVDCHPDTLDTIELRDKKGGDIVEFPDDLKVREFPPSVDDTPTIKGRV